MTGHRVLATGRALALAALTAMAAACAGPTHWQKPGAGVEDWDRDEGTCRARARTLSEKEFRNRAAEVDSPVFGSPTTLDRQMAVYDVRRRERQLFEDCMKSKGYAPDKGAQK